MGVERRHGRLQTEEDVESEDMIKELVTISVDALPFGLTLQRDTVLVKEVRGVAQAKGIEVGWSLVEVDGEPVTAEDWKEKFLASARKEKLTSEPFEIKFETSGLIQV